MKSDIDVFFIEEIFNDLFYNRMCPESRNIRMITYGAGYEMFNQAMREHLNEYIEEEDDIYIK